MDLGLSDWVEVHELLKGSYPDLPPHEAYLKFLDDALIKYPEQVNRIIGPEVGQAIDSGIEIGEIIGLACGRWELLVVFKAIRLAGRGCGAFYKWLVGTSPTTVGNSGRDIDEISSQLNAEILKKFAPTTVEASQSTTLASLKGMLQSYNRPEIYGQVIGIFVLMEAVRQIKRLADQTERISQSMAGIERNLESINAQGDYFPNHIHSYVKMMLLKNWNDDVPHYFIIYNKGTQWHPKFSELDRENPLGERFLGHRTDLDELCAFLAEEVRPRVEEEAIFHVLMPTIGPLAITEAVTFPNAMRPFLIHGERGDCGSQFVWLCTPEQQDRDCLHDIGILEPRPIWEAVSKFEPLSPFLSEYPFSPKPKFFIDPTFQLPVGVSGSLGYVFYTFCGPEPPRVLGQPAPPRPWV